jgi:hypothetical protein
VDQSEQVPLQLDGQPWQCTICLGDEKECEHSLSPNVIYCIPCGHKFHVDCIGPWMLIRDTCPLCRVRVTGYSNVSIISSVQGRKKRRMKTKKNKKQSKRK